MGVERKEINVEVGRRLRTARENGGYTQEAFAEVLDIGTEHYRKLEKGVYSLQPEKMRILYEEYKIDPTYLITGKKVSTFNIEVFLANSSREERDGFVDRMLEYMRKMLIAQK